jgi:periplasmic divalent cation tolerance protein
MSENDGTSPQRERPVPTPVTVPAPNAVLVVLTNAPDRETAEALADALVQEKLAACVNILAPCQSVYRWQGAIERAEEVPMLIKTAQDRYAALQRRLVELHPYDVPEVLAWRPQAGWPAYANWVFAETRPPRERRG